MYVCMNIYIYICVCVCTARPGCRLSSGGVFCGSTDLNVTVGLASNPAGTVFRWYSAWVEILSATAVLPAEISHVDMLLCAGLDPLAGVSLDPVALAAVLQLHCSWTLGSSVALPTSQPLSVSFAGNVGMEAPAVEEPYFSIVLVEEGGGWILAGGPSAAFRLHDVLGNIRVVGLGGSSQVFNEYAGWTVLFDPHPSAQQLLGPALEVSFPLLRWSESSSSAPLPVQFHRISDPLNQEEEVLGPVLLSSGMVRTASKIFHLECCSSPTAPHTLSPQ